MSIADEKQPGAPTDAEMPSVSLQAMMGIFQSVVGDKITPESDFFESGGDSLLVTRVLAAIARRYGVELTFEDFLRVPSPRLLAQKIGGGPE